jgi:type VI secretion system protein ImpJ
VTLPLRITERGEVYAAAIDNDRYFAAPQIFLAINSDIKRDELLRKVPNLVKVSSANRMEQLIRQALPGVGLQHVPNPPSALPIKLDFQYYAVDRAGPDWDAVRTNRNIAAYVPSDFPNPQLELVIILPAE